MKVLLSVYFFIFAAIQLGLLIGISHYLSGKSQKNPNAYWLGALLTSICGLFLFAIGILFTDDVQFPPFVFTVANVFFFIAAIFQGLFFYSINTAIKKPLLIGFALAVVIFSILFEYLRRYADFESRTVLAVSSYVILLAWQFREANIIYRRSGWQQLIYFKYAAIGEFLFLIPRLIVLISTPYTIRAIEQLPQLLILFTLGQILMNTLSFIAIWGFWSEKLALESRQTETENEAFKKLLDERETLIASLLKANKTSTTGALSASIAHEINQPLGAIQINSEYLQKKIGEEELDRNLITRIAQDIASDNMRAARIIRTLKAIFTEKYDAVTEYANVQEVVDSVLLLSKSDLDDKKIQVEINIKTSVEIPISFDEAQQLFLNLINNSVQALASLNFQHKKIVILGQEQGEHTVIRIEDNGLGISVDQQKNLFDLFASTKREGMGLGLWLCNHIVTRHGGQILYDKNYQEGAAFEIRFALNK